MAGRPCRPATRGREHPERGPAAGNGRGAGRPGTPGRRVVRCAPSRARETAARADAEQLRKRLADGEWVVDLRNRVALAAGHVAGTLSFGLDGSFATYLGRLIPCGTPLTLLAETPEQVAEAQRELASP